ERYAHARGPADRDLRPRGAPGRSGKARAGAPIAEHARLSLRVRAAAPIVAGIPMPPRPSPPMPIDAARFPRTRMRRSRARGWSRDLVREHRLSAADFLWPV